MKILIDDLTKAAGTRSDNDARLMGQAAIELERQQIQIDGLLRGLDMLSHDVLAHIDESKKVCDQIFAAIVRHLGPPPNS